MNLQLINFKGVINLNIYTNTENIVVCDIPTCPEYYESDDNYHSDDNYQSDEYKNYYSDEYNELQRENIIIMIDNNLFIFITSYPLFCNL